MARIQDADRTVFEELYKTVLDNFSDHDMLEIGESAALLRSILENAKRKNARDANSVGHA
jgi:hypothetical protein